jgi:hypothetical protein
MALTYGVTLRRDRDEDMPRTQGAPRRRGPGDPRAAFAGGGALPGALEGLRVLELGDFISAPYAGKRTWALMSLR